MGIDYKDVARNAVTLISNYKGSGYYYKGDDTDHHSLLAFSMERMAYIKGVADMADAMKDLLDK